MVSTVTSKFEAVIEPLSPLVYDTLRVPPARVCTAPETHFSQDSSSFLTSPSTATPEPPGLVIVPPTVDTVHVLSVVPDVVVSLEEVPAFSVAERTVPLPSVVVPL